MILVVSNSGLEQHSVNWYRQMEMLRELNPDNACIFRITHISNVSWILANGLHCQNSDNRDPCFVTIGDPDLIIKRASRIVPIQPGGSLSDYIPFYFTPLSPMMYNIITGYRGIRERTRSELVVMVSSLRDLADSEVVTLYTDRHAYLRAAKFFSSLDDLGKINWPQLQSHDFRHDPDDPEKVDRYQAEALVHEHLPVEHLSAIICYDDPAHELLEQTKDELGVNLTITINQRWYFK